MAIALTTGPTDNLGSGTGNTVSITMTLTSGRSLVVLLETYTVASQTVTSVTCTGESNLTLIGTIQQNASVDNVAMQLAYLSNITASGSKTITATFGTNTGPSLRRITGLEFSGGDTTGFYDSAENGGTGNSANPSISLTTNTDNDLIIGLAATDAGSPTVGSGYTVIALTDMSWWDTGEYDVDVGTAGSKNFNWTLASGNWCLKAAAFKPSGGAAATTKQLAALGVG